MEGQLYEELKKCDDDALMEEVEGTPGVYRVTTSVPLHELSIEGMSVVPQTLEGQAPPPVDNLFAMLPDSVAIAMAKYLFMMLALYSLCALLFMLPLYMWRVPQAALISVEVVSGVSMVLSYATMCAMHGNVARYPAVASLALAGWLCGLAGMLGAAAGLAQSVAPLQLLMFWWVQYAALSVYLQWLGPQGTQGHQASSLHAMLAMALSTLVVWGLFIATFAEAHDWLVSLALLAIAVFSMFYTTHHMQRTIAGRRYAKTRIDLLAALHDYWVDSTMGLICCTCERE